MSRRHERRHKFQRAGDRYRTPLADIGMGRADLDTPGSQGGRSGRGVSAAKVFGFYDADADKPAPVRIIEPTP